MGSAGILRKGWAIAAHLLNQLNLETEFFAKAQVKADGAVSRSPRYFSSATYFSKMNSAFGPSVCMSVGAGDIAEGRGPRQGVANS